MEVVQPIIKAKERIYRHYTVNVVKPTPIVEKIASGKSEFLYVGVNSMVIDSLVSIFDSGYAADSATKAIIIMKKVVESGNEQPSLILVDGSLGLSSLNELNKYFSTSKQLQAIPFFVESSNMKQVDIAEMGKLSFVDELVSLEQFNGRLLSKIKIIGKIKDNNLQAAWQQKIDQGIERKKYSFAFLKRAFDIVISLACLLFLSPLLLLITIAIKLESKGPVFYIAKRAGRGYRIFNFYKFRTMQVGADTKLAELSELNQYQAGEEEGIAGPVFFKVNNDPRVTKVGSFLRNTSLDELPQMINVLLGDMSLVGNRPLPLYEAQTLTTDEWAARFMAPAGITGLWQIKKRGQDGMSVEERINLDIDYANRNNFMYDLWIMANTPPALMQKSNS